MDLDVHATLAWGVGPAAMARACHRFGVTHVVMPATLVRPSLLARLRRRRLADYQEMLIGVQIVLVDARGAAQAIERPQTQPDKIALSV